VKTCPILSLDRELPGLLRVALVFVALLAATAVRSRASERWATLEAIHQLENPTDSPQPGSLGELGAYQFREETWRMHTTAPFSRALDRRSSDAVAVKHYDWIKSVLEKRGIVVTPFRVALAWNGGISAALREHPPGIAIDYASRAANLASYFEQSELAGGP
jgi:hypothetical protein